MFVRGNIMEPSISLLSCRQLEENKFGRTCESVAELISASTADEHANNAEAVKGYIKKLEGMFMSCSQFHGQYIRSLDEKVGVDHVESKWVVSITDLYNKIHAKCMYFINTNNEVIQRSPKEAGSYKLGLQKLTFDSFDGEIRKYPRLKQQFLSYINPKYLKEQEAFALRSYLSPNIKEQVEGVGEIAGENWKTTRSKAAVRDNNVVFLFRTRTHGKNCERIFKCGRKIVVNHTIIFYTRHVLRMFSVSTATNKTRR